MTVCKYYWPILEWTKYAGLVLHVPVYVHPLPGHLNNWGHKLRVYALFQTPLHHWFKSLKRTFNCLHRLIRAQAEVMIMNVSRWQTRHLRSSRRACVYVSTDYKIWVYLHIFLMYVWQRYTGNFAFMFTDGNGRKHNLFVICCYCECTQINVVFTDSKNVLL